MKALPNLQSRSPSQSATSNRPVGKLQLDGVFLGRKHDQKSNRLCPSLGVNSVRFSNSCFRKTSPGSLSWNQIDPASLARTSTSPSASQSTNRKVPPKWSPFSDGATCAWWTSKQNMRCQSQTVSNRTKTNHQQTSRKYQSILFLLHCSRGFCSRPQNLDLSADRGLARHS